MELIQVIRKTVSRVKAWTNENFPKKDEVEKEAKRSNNIFANSLKGNASGESVLLPDVSPIEHIMDVKVSSKNLEKVTSGVNVTFENGVATQVSADTKTEIEAKFQFFQDDTYISGGIVDTLTNTGKYSYTFARPAFGNRIVYGINGRVEDTTVSIDISDLPEGVYTISANFTNITQGSISWRDIQIEKGSVATEYTPPVKDLSAVKLSVEGKDGILTYTVNADGTVDGVTSIAPSTTLTTDAEGALIECEYNKDANKVVKSLEERLAALEAAIVSQ